MVTYETRRTLREQTLSVGREWFVISVPGRDETDSTLWFAFNRVTRRSSKSFNTYDEALADARKRNGLA